MPAPVPPSSEPSRLMSRTWGGILWLLVLVSLVVMWLTPADPKQTKSAVGTSPEVELEFETAAGRRPARLVRRQVAPFTFTERSGETVTNETLLGKPWAVNFIFTSCVASCPANTKAMMQLAQAGQDLDVRFVTVTVDPERDTPERLRDYAEIYGADPEQWLFLTGDKQEIHNLILTNFLLGVEEKFGSDRLVGYEFAHSDLVMHIDAEGYIVGKYLATDDVEMAKLRRVLAGTLETPKENRFLVAEPIPEEEIEAPANAIPLTEPQASAPEADPAEAANQAVADVPAVAKGQAPAWVARLPAVNASLNGLATALLLLGFVMIKQKQVNAHRNCMAAAFLVSILFLACYLTYHFGLQYYTGESSKKFTGPAPIRAVYLSILITHILLAVAVPVLAVGTLYQAWKQNWARHQTWARITFPIWLYVSVTGVVIYGMLYHL